MRRAAVLSQKIFDPDVRHIAGLMDHYLGKGSVNVDCHSKVLRVMFKDECLFLKIPGCNFANEF